MNKRTVMVVAGEASGDLHGSEICRKLIASDPNIHCCGMGSRKMREAGVELFYDSANIAVIGLWEVLKHWGDIQQALKTLKKQLAENPPDLLVLIDYQEFNLKLAKTAKQLGIKVLFYVSPQVWAWRQGRIKKFKDRIDMMAVVFPFEVKYFEQAGIPVRYVGHPLINKVFTTKNRQEVCAEYQLNPGHKLVAIMPGSRISEVQRILPIMLESAKLVHDQTLNTQFILPCASDKLKSMIESELHKHELDITITSTELYNIVGNCNAAMVASGTATLEVALLGTPLTIIYKVSSFTYAILSRLIKIPFVGLANIVAEQQVVREFIQNKALPEEISEEICKLIKEDTYHSSAKQKLSIVKEKLGNTDGIDGVVSLIQEMLQK